MRILFVTANRVGDAVLSTGLAAWLAERHAGARITVAAGPAATSLFRGMPGLDRVIALEKRPGGAHWLSLWRRCIATRWDLIVDLRRSALAYCLMGRRRHVVPRPDASMHRVRHVAATLGLQDDPPAPVLWTAAEDAAARERIPGSRPVLAIAPAANWRGKQWHAERFAVLARRLTGEDGILPGARVAVFAAAVERSQAAPVLEALAADRRIDLVGAGDLTYVGACLRRCSFFVGNDSGLMHMAAAAGLPTLGLFGPSRPEHYAPWGPKGACVRTAIRYEELVGGPGYDHRTTETLMDSLTIDMAEEAANDLWRRVSREAA